MFQFCNLNTVENIAFSQWRGPNRNGIYPESGLLKKWPENGPELIWRYDSLGVGYATTAVISDKIITIATIDSINYIVAFDHKGSIIYKKKLAYEWMINYPGSRSTPLLYDGLGYFLSGLGELYCFNVENGDIVWQKNMVAEFDGRNGTYGFSENLLIDEDKIFCTPGGEKDNIIALNRFTGDLIWSSEGKGEISWYGTPILIEKGKEKYLVVSTDSSLFSVSSRTGELMWSYDTLIQTSNIPIYRNGYLLIVGLSSYYNTLLLDGAIMLKIADDMRSVSEVWVSKKMNFGMGDVVVLENNIYGVDCRKRNIYCLDWETGAVKDSIKISSLTSTLISAEGLIYSYQYQGGEFNLLKHDQNGFKNMGTFKVEGGNESQHCSHPVIYNGRLYIRHDNSLFVYNLKEK